MMNALDDFQNMLERQLDKANVKLAADPDDRMARLVANNRAEALTDLKTDMRNWKDLVGSTDPVFLREAADLAEKFGRTEWAEAMRESAEHFD